MPSGWGGCQQSPVPVGAYLVLPLLVSILPVPPVLAVPEWGRNTQLSAHAVKLPLET